jgi:hypothetical protein
MDPRTQCNICLGAILVLILLVAALIVVKVRKNKEGFTFGTPATPRLREAAGDLFVDLGRMVALARQFESQAAGVSDSTSVAGARLSAAQLTKALDRTQ